MKTSPGRVFYDRKRREGKSGKEALRIESYLPGFSRGEKGFRGDTALLTQVPPTVPRSIMTTRLPALVAFIAAANAPPPKPVIARS